MVEVLSASTLNRRLLRLSIPQNYKLQRQKQAVLQLLESQVGSGMAVIWSLKAVPLSPEFLFDCIQLPLKLVIQVNLLFQLPLKFFLATLKPVYFFFSFFHLALHCFQTQTQLWHKNRCWWKQVAIPQLSMTETLEQHLCNYESKDVIMEISVLFQHKCCTLLSDCSSATFWKGAAGASKKQNFA